MTLSPMKMSAFDESFFNGHRRASPKMGMNGSLSETIHGFEFGDYYKMGVPLQIPFDPEHQLEQGKVYRKIDVLQDDLQS